MAVLTLAIMVRSRFQSLRDSDGSLILKPVSVGHAGAMLQARRLGNELFVGVHSDEAILDNKGPTVMTLKERLVYFGLV